MPGVTFGVMIPQGWLYDLPEGLPPDALYDRIVETAQAIERAGFASGWFYDHFHPVPRQSASPVFECWTLTTAIAAVTSKLRIGQMVACNSYRNPALLAKMAACVDVLSKGRLEFGIGAGWFEDEHKGYGYPFESPADRIRRMNEAVEVIRRLWTEARVTHRGRYYTLEGAYCGPKPVQRPMPPITIGGGGEQLTLRAVAKWADRSNYFGSPEAFARKSRILDRHCQEVGRDPAKIERSYNENVVVAESAGEALEKAEGLARRAGHSLEEYKDRYVIGDPDEVAAWFRPYLEVGATYFVCFFPDGAEIEPLELFAREVVPRVEEMAREA